MAFDGFDWQPRHISFRHGLLQKADDRARSDVFLDIATDVQYDELGGVQLRFPFAASIFGSGAIFGGGTLANCRYLAVVNDELCVFTDTALYSWNEQLDKWVLRSTHLAVSVDERPAFVTSDDQVTSDRAELNGTILFAWSVNNATVYVVAIDKTTGSVLMAPTALAAGTFSRPRLVSLASKILLFWTAATDLFVIAVDPASPATALGGAATTVLATNANLYYDVVKAGTQDLCVGAIRRQTTTSYTAFTVTPALTVTTSTKARTCDGPIAVATIPDGTQIQVVRGNGTAIQGDLLTTSTLADVFTGQAIGTASVSLQQVSVAFSTVQVGGFYVAHAFWSRAESATGTDGTLDHGSVDTNNTVGSSSTLVRKLGLASRAFPAGGRVFIWGAFARDNEVTGLSGAVSAGVRAQLQNTYFLYRDDGFLVSKALFDVAGGHAALTGILPGVAPTSVTGLDFAWAGTRRRIIQLGGTKHEGFEARSPVDVRFSFDSNLSRRSAAMGRTLYVTDSIPLQYDGTGLYEVGFLTYPYNFFVTTGGGGSLTAGDYVYKSTVAWTNAMGEKERSTTAMAALITAPGANQNAIQVNALNYTKKTGTGATPTVEVWRTEVDPIEDSPFYLVSGKDPNVLAGAGNDNGYIPNLHTAAVVPPTGFFVMNDDFADTTLITKEKDPEAGLVLEKLAPPGASLIVTTDTRVFLAGVPGDPDAVWYSRLRNEGEVASFHDGNRALVPRPGGAMTALAIHQETPTVFREAAIYRLLGEGKNNTGQGNNYVAIDVPGGVGAVNQESVATTPLGTIFKSRKGWYLLTPGWSVIYIGDRVSDYDGETVKGVSTVEDKHQVRILSGTRMIVWDYSAVTEEAPLGQWFEWTVGTAVHSIIWRGQYVALTPTGPTAQRTEHTGGDYGIDVETANIKLADLQGAAAVRAFQILGEYRSSFLLWVRVAYNYGRSGSTPVYVDSKVWTPSPTTVGGPLQLRHGTKRRRCESIKIRLTAVTDAAKALLLCESAGGMNVATDSTRWSAVIQAVAPGELGNLVTLSISFVDAGSAGISFDVRDHFVYDSATATWSPAVNTIGVVVYMTSILRPTVLQLENAITAGTALATVAIPDTPTKIVAASIIGATRSNALTGGAFGAPAGEGLKLTGLALEVGYERGMFNRLPAAQRQ